MQVITVDPTSDPRWEDLVGSAPDGAIFHSPPWISALRDAYGFAPRAHIVVDCSGKPRGGVAFCELDDALGARVVSLPFSDVCDPLIIDDEAWPLLLARLGERRMAVEFRCLSDRCPGSDPAFAVTKRARWHTVLLSAPAVALRSQFGDTTRRAVAKAERSGVVVRPLDGEGGLAGFVRLHISLRKRKYRMLAQPPAFFSALAAHFSAVGKWYPLGAFLGSHLLAATLFLHWGDTLYYKFNASDLADGLELRPNNLLVWAGIQLAESLGCRALDLGPSDDNQPGLIRFKRDFGATERELRFLKWTPPGSTLEQPSALREVFGELTKLLTEPNVPDEVTAAAGALLYRYFA